ncbi:MAG TPA: VWA domain-containing protein [Bryobacteraceae bacterium]|nr:VWA domain-containing protein [Bryobacteraceae bacterium]
MKYFWLLCGGLLTAQQKADIRVDVDLVTVACSATDRGGAPVKNLKPEDFVLSDNGVPQKIGQFWQESDLPLTVALVADISGSQAMFIKNHRDAVAQFLRQVIGPQDRAMVVEVAQQAWLVSDLTNDPDALRMSVQNIGLRQSKDAPLLGQRCRGEGMRRGCGGTALWHGIYYTARLGLRPVTGRKAIVVLSDGMDTGSDFSLTDTIEMVQTAETVVYSIKYANPLRYMSLGATIAQAVSRGLERMSRETGGVTYPNPGRRLGEVFSQIEADLRNLYVIGFTPAVEARDGKFHKLEVKPVRKDIVVRARAGYWARGN